MGSGNSHPATHYLDTSMMHEQPPAPYPDMNMIFKSIPKMMQVADDMHRMSNYMMDLRNMMFACSVLSALGIVLFLLIKYLHGRKGGSSRRRQRRHHNNHRTDDSEQSSLSLGRPTGGGAGAGGSTSGYRHYHAARPVDGWAAHTAALGGADSAPRLMVDSTSTRHTHIGTPQHGGVGTSTTAPLLMNTPTKGLVSPEHHHHAYQQHQQQQQYAALRDTSPQHETPTTSPTSIAPHGTGKAAANGQLKRLDPVKLVVEEMPYMDNEQE
ncbi:hypothetical protein GPALN_014445 [Globodera pallida]|nr:hypothetical protein GPALN_014445 [Globodera pallida]